MKYQQTACTENEKKLFYRLEGEAAERHGAIGHLRADFGRGGDEFYSTWFDNQKHLKTPDFRVEFDSIINFLRSKAEQPIFSSRHEMRKFTLAHSGWQIKDGVVGLKTQTADHTYLIRCRPSASDYDIYCFAFNNSYLQPELAGQHELPNDCFSILPSTGEVIFIKKDEAGYFRQQQSTSDLAINRQIVTANNTLLGVTRAQEEAMLGGSLFGWDAPAAKPWNYDKNGSPRPLPERKRDVPALDHSR